MKTSVKLLVIATVCMLFLDGGYSQIYYPPGNCAAPIIPLLCLVNPCQFATCRAYPRAICRPNYCRCKPEFSLDGHPLTDSKCQDVCPFGTVKIFCDHDPCKYATCPKHPQALCKANSCTQCKAEFYLNGWLLDESECRLVGSCPDGRPLFNCLVSPCETASCPRVPNAECRDNFCGGCNAEFFNFGVRLSDSECTIGYCPGGHHPVACLVDPCLTARCPGNPSAICRASYCGGCVAEFWHSGRKLDSSDCTRSPCPGGQQPVYCFIRPCEVASCPAYPNAVCVDNYCGGCNADFWNGRIRLSKQDCENVCPDGSTPVYCFARPCDTASCPNFPSAECRDNYCGGCNADFYYLGTKLSPSQCDSGNIPVCRNTVTSATTYICPSTSCGICSYDEDCCFDGYCYRCQKKYTYDPRCSPIDDFMLCTYQHQCSSSSDCGRNRICCPTRCGTTCKKLSNIPSCTFSPLTTALHGSCPDWCGEGWGCTGYGEHCCFNGLCHMCERKDEPVLPNCKAYNSGYTTPGYYCDNMCVSNAQCGRLEVCCFDGNCRKCELRDGVGPGFPVCKASAASSTSILFDRVSCTDDCGADRPCPYGEQCCFNGVCRKCESVGHGDDIPLCPTQFPFSIPSIGCVNQCSKYNPCTYPKKCCSDGWCNVCRVGTIF